MFYSTNNPLLKVSFSEAVLKGIAPGGGLFMPSAIPVLPEKFFETIDSLSFPELAFNVANTFLGGAIGSKDLEAIVADAIDFEAPLVNISEHIYALELFHGPTLAFKDFGARFLARTLAWLTKDNDREITVLVATSGDTGSAVAQGFYQVPGIRVCLLYPSGKVSRIQEQQLTTLGENITALEVDGTFDDCQRMVKEAFSDRELASKIQLTSANSINIARLLPQMFYYFHAYAQLEDKSKPLVFSVPSGNFGNLTAGLFAWKMGLPVTQFVAATNRNDVVPEYLSSGRYQPKPSIPTISNAMDVGAPSNFARMLDLFGAELSAFRDIITGCSFSDEATREIIKMVHNQHGYVMDPHGAVAFLGLRAYMQGKRELNGIFLETAHPAKFRDIVEGILQKKVFVPERLADCLDKPKRSIRIKAGLEALREVLIPG